MVAVLPLQISEITQSYLECLLGWFPAVATMTYHKDNAFINSSGKYVSKAMSLVLDTMSDIKDTRGE